MNRETNPIESHKMNLAAPCGMYCGMCRHYLARAKGILKEKRLKHGCRGCRVQDKNCAWVKKGCVLLRKKQVAFCFECEVFPCENLRKLDERHSLDENISFIDNLLRIKDIGAKAWLVEQEEKWQCPECGGDVCIDDGDCYDCGCKVG